MKIIISTNKLIKLVYLHKGIFRFWAVNKNINLQFKTYAMINYLFALW